MQVGMISCKGDKHEFKDYSLHGLRNQHAWSKQLQETNEKVLYAKGSRYVRGT